MSHKTHCRVRGIGVPAVRVPRQEDLDGKKAKKETNRNKEYVRDADISWFSHLAFRNPQGRD